MPPSLNRFHVILTSESEPTIELDIVASFLPRRGEYLKVAGKRYRVWDITHEVYGQLNIEVPPQAIAFVHARSA